MKIRGLKLQMAIQLTAEGNLNEAEIAKQTEMRINNLLELMQDPLFVRRVKEVRCARLEGDLWRPRWRSDGPHFAHPASDMGAVGHAAPMPFRCVAKSLIRPV
jgi:hypothetical protein